MGIKLLDHCFSIPKYQTRYSSGFDVYASNSEDIIIHPMERKLIPTGFILELSRGEEVQLRARSGLAIKHGVTLINGIGTIDPDYREEVFVPLVNLSVVPYTVKRGDRIAQGVYLFTNLLEGIPVIEAERQGGFGSTGIRE